MPSTTIDFTSVVSPILTSATTWANTKGASVQDPIAFAAFNQSGINVRVTANSAATSASAAIPVLSSGYLSREFTRKSIGLYGFTTNSTATLIVETDR